MRGFVKLKLSSRSKWEGEAINSENRSSPLVTTGETFDADCESFGLGEVTVYEAKAGANAEREIMVRGKWLSHSPAWLAGDKRNLGQSDSPEWRIGVRRGQSQRSPGMHEAEMAIMNEADEASHLPGVALSRGLSEESTNEMR